MMKTLPILISSSLLALSVAACSPAGSGADASATDSAAVSAAASIAPPVATVTDDTAVTGDDGVAASSAASSVTVVIAQATDTYDPVVIDKMGRQPGYWELRHTDPDTHKVVIDKVCIDKTTGARMVSDHGRVVAPANHAAPKTTASRLGACPGDVRAGEVVRHDGKKVDAWNGHGPDRVSQNDKDRNNTDRNSQPSDHESHNNGPANNGASGHDQPGRNDDHAASSSRARPDDSQAHNPHATPAEQHGDAPNDHHASESSHQR